MKIASVLLIAFMLAGCFGQKVEVPAAHIGKIMTKNGYKDGYISTSKFRLDYCFIYCDKLVLLNVSDGAYTEPMNLFMPQDRLEMKFDLRMTLAVDPSSYDSLYSRVTPVTSGNMDHIPLRTVYDTYAKQIVRSEMRSFLSEFSIAEIVSSREAINAQLSQRLSTVVNERTPFQVRYAGLADIQYPDIIVKAQENAAERREMIQQEEAQLEISKVQLERELQEQRLKRAIEVEKSEAQAQIAAIQAASMTSAYITYRNLEIMEKIADSPNKVFLPIEMLSTIASQVMIGNQ
jgi:hypothetical protein